MTRGEMAKKNRRAKKKAGSRTKVKKFAKKNYKQIQTNGTYFHIFFLASPMKKSFRLERDRHQFVSKKRYFVFSVFFAVRIFSIVFAFCWLCTCFQWFVCIGSLARCFVLLLLLLLESARWFWIQFYATNSSIFT